MVGNLCALLFTSGGIFFLVNINSFIKKIITFEVLLIKFNYVYLLIYRETLILNLRLAHDNLNSHGKVGELEAGFQVIGR